jgi:hypothetical protein
MPPTIVVQGLFDHAVRPANADRVVQQWLAYRALAHPGAVDPERTTRATTAAYPAKGRSRGYTVRRWYNARGREQLEVWTVQGLGMPGPEGRRAARSATRAGPRASTAIWGFLSLHRLS